MKLEKGQFWVHIHNPYLAYKVSKIDYLTLNKIGCFCEVWFRPDTGGGQMNFITKNKYLLVDEPEFKYWHLLYDNKVLE